MQEKYVKYFINLSFFIYFIVLIIERSLSVILSIANGIQLFSGGFNIYTYLLVFLSMIGFLIYLIILCRENIKALFHIDMEVSFIHLSIASGILLLSGMVHTEYTIPVIQFISYGILIVGILLQVILNHKESTNKPLLWLSFVYLVCLSMAIPVMYRSFIEAHVIFHIVEAIASFVLVFTFTYLLILLFKKENDLFLIWPALAVLCLDTPLIILRWSEEINFFVLIFLILTIVLFLFGFLYKKIKKEE